MKKADLNLLVIFDAIMREGSMTRTAEQLAMTQPAVSNAVARMRVAWNDPLFVKQGRGIVPTPHARVMWDRARPHLDDLRAMANPEPFDAANARRSFRISTDDLSASLLWRALRRVTEHSAAGIDFHAVPNAGSSNVEDLLVNANVDVVISGEMAASAPHIRQQTLLNSHYVCAMRTDHPLASEPLTLESFAAADHVMMSLSGDTTGPVDELLQARGLSRRVAMTVNHFSLIPRLLKESDLISTVPFEAVAESVYRDELRVFQPLMDIPPIKLTLLWHERSDRDTGLCWLRDQLEAILREAQIRLPIPDCADPRQPWPASRHESGGEALVAGV